jgi:glutaredoxin 3
MAEVRIYTTPYCPFCVAAKALLQKKDVPFEEIDVSLDPDLRDRMVARSGRRTVPQIFIDGTPIGGYDELNAMDRAGGLDRRLGTAPGDGPESNAA